MDTLSERPRIRQHGPGSGGARRMSVVDTITTAAVGTVLAPDGTIGRVGADRLHSAPVDGHTLRSDAASVTNSGLPDDLSREVYCILGLPIDAITMHDVLCRIQSAVAARTPFLMSTANLNWLVMGESEPDFRKTMLLSDLCTADGMAIVWIARLLGIPVKTRITGCDIFYALKARHTGAHPLKVFLFGGAEGVGAAASRTLNAQPVGLRCAGVFYPGFCSVEEMSRDDIIDYINSSGADFLVASLGARKGQSWLQRNRHRISIPIRAHLGTLINFQAGKFRRAPLTMQRLGLEWLWRIKEEPYLWRRYWYDGSVLLRLLFTRVLPLAFWTRLLRRKYERQGDELIIAQRCGCESVMVSLCGTADARHVDKVIGAFQDAIATKKRIILDFSKTRTVDARFLGLLLMLKKKLNGVAGLGLSFVGLSTGLERVFRLNGLEFMLIESSLHKPPNTVREPPTPW